MRTRDVEGNEEDEQEVELDDEEEDEVAPDEDDYAMVSDRQSCYRCVGRAHGDGGHVLGYREVILESDYTS